MALKILDRYKEEKDRYKEEKESFERTKNKLKKKKDTGQIAGGPGKIQTTQKSKRDDVDPRIGKGKTSPDAGFVGQMKRADRAKLKKLEAEGQFAGGPGKVQTTQKSKRDDVDPRIGTGKGSDDAGPAGQEARRTKAKIDTKGMTPSRKLAKDEGKISESDMVKGRRDTTAAAKQKAKKEKEDLRKRNLAGQRMGQRKAGGQIKKYAGGALIALAPGIKKGVKKIASSLKEKTKKKAGVLDDAAKKKATEELNELIRKSRKFSNPRELLKRGKPKLTPAKKRKPSTIKYSHGGKVGMKKCPRDGIAIRGKTRG